MNNDMRRIASVRPQLHEKYFIAKDGNVYRHNCGTPTFKCTKEDGTKLKYYFTDADFRRAANRLNRLDVKTRPEHTYIIDDLELRPLVRIDRDGDIFIKMKTYKFGKKNHKKVDRINLMSSDGPKQLSYFVYSLMHAWKPENDKLYPTIGLNKMKEPKLKNRAGEVNLYPQTIHNLKIKSDSNVDLFKPRTVKDIKPPKGLFEDDWLA